jgi:hypothetical protein
MKYRSRSPVRTEVSACVKKTQYPGERDELGGVCAQVYTCAGMAFICSNLDRSL